MNFSKVLVQEYPPWSNHSFNSWVYSQKQALKTFALDSPPSPRPSSCFLAPSWPRNQKMVLGIQTLSIYDQLFLWQHFVYLMQHWESSLIPLSLPVSGKVSLDQVQQMMMMWFWSWSWLDRRQTHWEHQSDLVCRTLLTSPPCTPSPAPWHRSRSCCAPTPAEDCTSPDTRDYQHRCPHC